MKKHVIKGELSGLEIMRLVRQWDRRVIKARYSGEYTIVYTI